MNISFLKSALSITPQIATDPLRAKESDINERNIFFDFSEADRRLSNLIKKGICDEQGNPTEKFEKILLNSVPKTEPIFTSLFQVLDFVDPNNAENSSPISKLIQDLKIMNPGKIKEVQIIGSQLKRVLLKHPEILTSWMAEVFGPDIDKETLDEWTKRVLANENFFNNLHAGQETDIRIVCHDNCTLDDLSKLSGQARIWFETNIPHLGSINKFSKINDTTTLVGFEFDENPKKSRELIFTSSPATLSSETCLFVTMDEQELRFGCLGFSIAKVLIDSDCNIYTPFALDNPQAWIRLMYYSNNISMNDREKLMIECLLKPFEQVKCLDDYIFVMDKLGYKKWDVQNYIKEAVFSDVQEQIKALYLYFLIKRRIKAKATPEGTPPSPDSNALFVFHCFQSLQMHGQLSDQSIANLIGWLNEDSLLIYTETHAFLTLFAQGNVPFSVTSAITTLAGWIEQPDSFIRRQVPSIFLMKQPFTLRAPSDLLTALKVIQNHLESGGNSEILKTLYQYFINKTELKKAHQQKISQMLNLSEASLALETDFLLDSEDPFICSLGMQIKLMSGYSKNPLYLFDKLPDMLELGTDLDHHLKAFYEYIKPSFEIPGELPTDHLLANWIGFLIDSNQNNLILLAYSLWKKNRANNSKALNLCMLNGLSKADSRLAVLLFIELYPHSDFDSEFILKIISNISDNYPSSIFNKEIYPLMAALLTDTSKNCLEINNKFSRLTIDFLNDIVDQKKQKHLMSAAALKGYIKFSEIPEKLKPCLIPILPILKYRQATGLTFSACEIEVMLSCFNHENLQTIPESVTLAWISILSWIFYPGPTSGKQSIPFEALREVNTYLNSEGCNTKVLKGLHEVFFTNDHPEKQTEICSLLEPEEFLLMLEVNSLLKHSDPTVSHVGLHVGINFPKYKNLNLFLLRLSELLNDASLHQNALTALFNKIALKFNLSAEKFNPLLLNDWIKLLAQTRDPYFIDLGCDIWKENHEKCQKNSDLLLFQALTLCDPNLALHHFCDMHHIREPGLTVEERITCLRLIVRAYETQSLKIGLKRLIPIISDLINQKKPWKPAIKKKLSPLLVFMINRFESEGFDSELLLKSIAKDFIHPSEMNSQLLNTLFFNETQKSNLKTSEISQKARITAGRYLLEQNDERCYILLDGLIEEKISQGLPVIFNLFLADCLKNLITTGFRNPKNFARLNRLIQTAPPSKDVVSNEILTDFLRSFFEEDSTLIAESDLSLIEELAFKHKEILFKLANWNSYLLSYVKRTPISGERPHLYELFCCLLYKDNSLKEVELLQTIAVMMDKYFPQSLHSAIKQYITSRKENPIDIFKHSKEFEIVRIYIRIDLHYKIAVKDLAVNIWNICIELSRGEQAAMPDIIKLLELQNKKNWQPFFTAEKNRKEHSENIPIILNRLFKEEIEQDSEDLLEWASFFLRIYLESPFSKTSPFNPDCSEENFIYIALKLLALEPTLEMKKYLLTGRQLRNNLLKNAAKCEIDAQLKLTKNIDIIFCLELREIYFSQDNSVLYSIVNSLPFCNDKTVIPFIIEEVEKLKTGSPDDLITCWISIFEFLKQTRDQEIWRFLTHLPPVFNLNGQSYSKEIATEILIEGAVLELKIRSNKNKHSEYTSELLWNKIKYLQLKPYLYLLVFSCMEDNFIISQPQECLLVGAQVYISLITDEDKRPFFFQKLKDNFELLFKLFEIQDNRNSLSDDSYAVLENCLNFSYKMGILDKNNFHKHCSLAQAILEKRLENIYQNDIKKCMKNGNHFFDLYTLFSQIADFETEEGRRLLFMGIKCLDNIHSIYKDIEEKKPRDDSFPMLLAGFNEIQKQLMELFNSGIYKILPENLNRFSESYFEAIFRSINELDPHISEAEFDPLFKHKYKYALYKAFCDRFIKILKENEDKPEFNRIKKMFERAMDWKIDATYLIAKPPLFIFDCIHELLSFAKNMKVYKTDPWLFSRSNLVKENQEEIKCIKDGAKRCEEIINRLIGYGTKVALGRACKFYITYFNFKHFNCEFFTDLNLRFSLFKALMKGSLVHSLTKFDGHSFLSFIHYQCYEKCSKGTLNTLLTNPNFRKYFQEIIKIEFNTNLTCLQNLMNKARTEGNGDCVHWIPHYIKIALDRLNDLADINLVQDINGDHFTRLEKLIDLIIDLEALHIEEKIEQVLNLKAYLPQEAMKVLIQSLLIKSRSQSESLKIEQYKLLNRFFKKLISINFNPEPVLTHKKCRLILTSLIEVIEKSRKLDKFKVEISLKPALEWLNEQDLNPQDRFKLEFIEYHFQVLDAEKEYIKFNCFSQELFQFSLHSEDWFRFYCILADRIQKVFNSQLLNPNYQKAAIDFISLHLHSFILKAPEVIQILANITTIAIFKMLKNGLINSTQSHWKDQLNLAIEVYKMYNLNIMPIKLAQLMLKFDEMPLEEKEASIQLIINPLAEWVLYSNDQRSAKHFILLFEKIPHLKTKLTKLWKTLIHKKT